MTTDKQVEAAIVAMCARAKQRDNANARWPDDYEEEEQECFRKDMRAALEATEAAAWQPIETAPMDGNTVLVACRDHQWSIRIAAYIPRFFEESAEDEAEYDEVSDKYYAHEGWYEQCLEHDEYMAIHMHKPPTHWRPLPAPPKETPDAR